MDKTVFLDRDGVINVLRMGEYITNWDDFEFLEGALDAIKMLANTELKIIIITNQSAINRGLITEENLKKLHSRMVHSIQNSGGRIDAIYYCPHRPDENCDCRKPKTGLFELATNDFEIDLSNSWFIGDFKSDEEVAKKVGLNFILAEGPGGLKRAVESILN